MISESRTLDSVTAEEWRTASSAEQKQFIERERKRGVVSFACLRCGFPTEHGCVGCEACR